MYQMIYLDNNATTRPSDRVVRAMLPYFTECYFNASASIAPFTGTDKPRRKAARAMAKLLNAEGPECFVFTSGATESNNWVFATAEQLFPRSKLVISSIEHPSVSEPATALARKGFHVMQIPVDNHGSIMLEALANYLDDETSLVSIMAANNETGVLQSIQDIGILIREHSPNALFHTDATQAVGKIPVDMQSAWEEVDLLSFSAHKFHGPKGIGGLYIRPNIQMEPMLRGGGQEKGLRAGTTNTPALAGLAVAAEEFDPMAMCKTRKLRDHFEAELRKHFPKVIIYSSSADRLPNTSCFSLQGIVGEELVQSLSTFDILVGTGSACSARAIHPPKTLLAMGIEYTLARASIRVSLSRFSTQYHIMEIVESLKFLYPKLLSRGQDLQNPPSKLDILPNRIFQRFQP